MITVTRIVPHPDGYQITHSDGRTEVISAEEMARRDAEAHDSAFRRGYAAARFAHALFNDGRGDRDAAMSTLAEAFPMLRGRVGVRPWNQVALWTSKQDLTSSAAQAAAFVLGVFNPRGLWAEEGQDEFPGAPLLKFDAHVALALWDAEHRGAFCGWASRPWWP